MSGVGGRQRQADAQQKFLHTQLVFVGEAHPQGAQYPAWRSRVLGAAQGPPTRGC